MSVTKKDIAEADIKAELRTGEIQKAEKTFNEILNKEKDNNEMDKG